MPALKIAEDAAASLAGSGKRVTDALPPMPEIPGVSDNDTLAKLTETVAGRLPSPSEIIEANYEFTTKVLQAQRDLTLHLLSLTSAKDN